MEHLRSQRLQPMAIGDKWSTRQNGSDTQKPLPWAATTCLRW